MIKQRRHQTPNDSRFGLRWQTKGKEREHHDKLVRKHSFPRCCRGIAVLLLLLLAISCDFRPWILTETLREDLYTKKFIQSNTWNLKKKKSPGDSKLPDPVPLLHQEPFVQQEATASFPIATEALMRRHECIFHIRERQFATYTSLLGKRSSPFRSMILLVDPAYHANVGDHMITAAEHIFLRRLGWDADTNAGKNNKNINPNAEFQECHYLQANEFVPHCDTLLHSQNPLHGQGKVAVWHGGGNWGDLWPQMQKIRLEQSFRALLQSNYSSVVGMPQSLYYQHPESEIADARLLKRALRLGVTAREGSFNFTSKVVLSWREYDSYHKAKRLYPYLTNVVVPDIAFQLGPYKPIRPAATHEHDFLFLLRRDHESTLLLDVFSNMDDTKNDDDEDGRVFPTDPNTIPRLLEDAVSSAMKVARTHGKTYSYRIVDWPDRWDMFDSDDPYFSDTSIQLLSLGRVVICDRLHAAILAFLTGLSFVYLDQITGKISKSLKLAFDSWDGCRE